VAYEALGGIWMVDNHELRELATLHGQLSLSLSDYTRVQH